MFETRLTSPKAVPFYYATLRVFRDLVEHLIVTYPQTLPLELRVRLYLTAPKGRIETDP